jgi:hypothetical protein
VTFRFVPVTNKCHFLWHNEFGYHVLYVSTLSGENITMMILVPYKFIKFNAGTNQMACGIWFVVQKLSILCREIHLLPRINNSNVPECSLADLTS